MLGAKLEYLWYQVGFDNLRDFNSMAISFEKSPDEVDSVIIYSYRNYLYLNPVIPTSKTIICTATKQFPLIII